MTDDPASPIDWQGGQPRSRLYGDIYFSTEDGLAETRAVFLDGCGLPERWRGRRRFVVGELGFGTGLNIAALLHLWRETREPDARLSIFSVEAHPITAGDAATALAAWPEIAAAAKGLTDRWPGRARGFHRVDLPAFAATLDLAVMDAEAALDAWSGRADAWFLDGFSPALNPAMWTERVLGLVGQRSAPGARAATFTVAGAVRRGLSAACFAPEKKPGHGRKRERLEAAFPGEAVDPPPLGRVAVIGAGIAGAALSRAFAAQGVQAEVFDPGGPGAGASGNPAALVTPRFDAGGGPAAALFAQAFGYAARVYRSETPQALVAETALQIETQARDVRRFDRIAAQDMFEPGTVARLSREPVGDRLGEPAPAGGLTLSDALVIEPQAVLAAWLPQVTRRKVIAVEPDGAHWRLLFEDGEARFDAVVLAAGWASAALAGLPVSPVRGQASFLAADERPAGAAWGGYVIPTRDGLLFGATHDRGDTGEDARPADDARNLAALALARPRLAERLGGRLLSARASIRGTTPDHLPIAGEVAPGLFALTGLAARGFCLAPLLAEHLAALATGAPSPLPRALAAACAPGRFSIAAAPDNKGETR